MGGEKGGSGGGGPTLRDFVVERVLGTGGSGVVARARRAGRGGGGGGQYVAVKAVSKRELVRSRRRVWFLRREVAIHRLVSKHHGVVALHEVFEDAEGVYMVMELLRGGDLFAQMARLGGRGLAEHIALRIVAQVLEVLAYAHGRGVAHRDIKLENVVFAQPPDLRAGERLRVKVVDWGLACLRAVAPDTAGGGGGGGGGEARTSGERVGTLRYCAPEICARDRYVPAQSDMWSVGVVLYAMLAHCHPYEGQNEKEMLAQILAAPLDLAGPRWAPVSMDTKILLRRLLSKHAASRPAAADALAEVARIQAKIARRRYVRPPHVPCATLVRSARPPPPAPHKAPPSAPPPPPPPPAPKPQARQDAPAAAAATQPLDAIGLAFGRFFGGLFKRNEVCA